MYKKGDVINDYLGNCGMHGDTRILQDIFPFNLYTEHLLSNSSQRTNLPLGKKFHSPQDTLEEKSKMENMRSKLLKMLPLAEWPDETSRRDSSGRMSSWRDRLDQVFL